MSSFLMGSAMGFAPGNRLLIAPMPSLGLADVFGRDRWTTAPFPFDRGWHQFYYLARNGIHALCTLWNLKDQEVLFPAYFHGVEVQTLLAAGVKLRFYPVDANMHVNPNDIVRLITPQTKAIYLIHFLGFPGPVEEVSKACRERKIPLIEDCALALLSSFHGQPLGSWADAAIFCLYKTLPLPNGGVLWLRNRPDAAALPPMSPPGLSSTLAYTASAVWRHLKMNSTSPIHRSLQALRQSARSLSGTLGVVPVGGEQFDPNRVGLSMSGVCRWILRRQDFAAIVKRRHHNYSILVERLRDLSPPLFDLDPGVCPLFVPIRTDHKLALLERLSELGVEGVNFWSSEPKALPEGAFPEVDGLRRSIVELPCHQGLSELDMEGLAGVVRTAWHDVVKSRPTPSRSRFPRPQPMASKQGSV